MNAPTKAPSACVGNEAETLRLKQMLGDLHALDLRAVDAGRWRDKLRLAAMTAIVTIDPTI